MPTTIWSHPCTGSLFNFGTLGGDPIIKIKWGDCLQHFQSEAKYLPCIHLKWQSPSLSIANEDVLRSLNIQLEWNIFLYLAKTPCHRGPNVGYLDFKKFRVKPNTITIITMMHYFFRHPVTGFQCLSVNPTKDHIWSLLQENSSKVTNMPSEVLSARWSRPYWGAASTCGATTAFFY